MKLKLTQRLCKLLLVISLGSTAAAHADDFKSLGGGFRADFAWKPQETLVAGPDGSLTLQSVAQSDGNALLVTTEKFTAKRFEAVDANLYFTSLATSIKGAFPNSSITNYAITHRGTPGRDVRIGSGTDEPQLRIRLFFRKRIGYRLTASGDKAFVDSSKVSTFFDSFAFLKSDDELSNEFVSVAAPSANFQALMLPQARGLLTKASADSDDVLKIIGANGNTQFYGIVHQEVAGLTTADATRIRKLTQNAIDRFTDGDAPGYRQTSVRNRTQSGIDITERQYRNAAEKYYLRERRFVHNNHIYWVFVSWGEGRGNSELATKFLDGFQLIKK